MKEDFTTIKIWSKTRRTLRLIAAATDESLVALIERLARDEVTRLEVGKGPPPGQKFKCENCGTPFEWADMHPRYELGGWRVHGLCNGCHSAQWSNPLPENPYHD